jgi:hypothetical protein
MPGRTFCAAKKPLSTKVSIASLSKLEALYPVISGFTITEQ